MFDISWSEFLLIGVVALIVIGPKELPTVMRTLGQWTRKMRSMASEFQSQFQEAMREAEMADLKKEVDDLAQSVTQYDPLKSVREDLDTLGHDIKSSLDSSAEQHAALPAAGEAAENSTTTAAPTEVAVAEAPGTEAPGTEAPGTEAPGTEAPETHTSETAAASTTTEAAAPAPVHVAEHVVEKTVAANGTERSG